MKSSSTKMNPDLANERGKASFNTTELTYLLYGGRQKTERKRFLGNQRLFESFCDLIIFLRNNIF